MLTEQIGSFFLSYFLIKTVDIIDTRRKQNGVKKKKKPSIYDYSE